MRSTLASHSAILRGTNVTRMNTNRVIWTATQRTQGLWGLVSVFRREIRPPTNASDSNRGDTSRSDASDATITIARFLIQGTKTIGMGLVINQWVLVSHYHVSDDWAKATEIDRAAVFCEDLRFLRGQRFSALSCTPEMLRVPGKGKSAKICGFSAIILVLGSVCSLWPWCHPL